MTLQESDLVTHSGERGAVAAGGGGVPAKPKLGQGSSGRLVVGGHGTGVDTGPGR